jgi:RimJ/RimL family protein N-acetyltransferase
MLRRFTHTVEARPSWGEQDEAPVRDPHQRPRPPAVVVSVEDGAPAVEIARTARLRLRELTLADAAFIRELVNDPAWLRFIGDRNVHSDDDARGYIDKIRDGSYAKHGFGLWAVEALETGEPVGICGLIRRDALEHPDLGFAFLERHRGLGYAREAAAIVLGLARERFGFTKLLAITDPENGASQKVLEHVGFRFDRRIDWAETGEVLWLYAQEFPA